MVRMSVLLLTLAAVAGVAAPPPESTVLPDLYCTVGASTYYFSYDSSKSGSPHNTDSIPAFGSSDGITNLTQAVGGFLETVDVVVSDPGDGGRLMGKEEGISVYDNTGYDDQYWRCSGINLATAVNAVRWRDILSRGYMSFGWYSSADYYPMTVTITGHGYDALWVPAHWEHDGEYSWWVEDHYEWYGADCYDVQYMWLQIYVDLNEPVARKPAARDQFARLPSFRGLLR